jgi:nitrous oxide reductase accessory protein NosL
MSKLLLLLFVSLIGLNAKMFQSVPLEKATILQSGKDKMYCPNCGMYLPKFYKTSHVARLKDGTIRQYCSMYCLVEEFEVTKYRGKSNLLDKVMVVDVTSLKYIDAKDAFYVVGSKVGGTMTMMSKYAFGKKTDAQKFANKNGGMIVDFEKAYDSAISDFAKDTALVHKKRSTKMYKMGKKLFYSSCDKDSLANIDAHTMGNMKALIKNSGICGKNLNDKQLQAIMLYYWDIRLKKFDELYGGNRAVQKEISKMNMAK